MCENENEKNGRSKWQEIIWPLIGTIAFTNQITEINSSQNMVILPQDQP